MKLDRLTEIVEVLAGRRGAQKDHAVRYGSIADLRAAIRNAVIDAERATARLERISDAIGGSTDGLDSGAETLIEAINLAQEEAEDAAADALAASTAADGVRDDHDALVGGFLGDLPTKFSEIDTDINTAAAQTLSLAVSTASQTGLGVLTSQFLDQGWDTWTNPPTRVDNEVHASGQTISWNILSGVNAGVRLVSTGPAWIGQVDADAYVVEVEYELLSGSLDGAGVLFDWNIDPAGEHRQQKTLAEMTSGPISTGKLLTARAVFRRAEGAGVPFLSHDVYLMASYTGFGAQAAKHIKFHKANVRLAMAEEMGEGEVKASLEEFAYAKADVDSAVTLLRKNLHAGLSPANEVHTPNANNPDNKNSDGLRVGQWSNAIASSDVPSGAPAGAMSIEVTGGQAREMPGRLTPLDGRTIRVAGWAKSNGQFRFAARNSSGVLIPNTSTALESHATWTFVTRTIEVPSGQSVADWCPGFDMPDESTWVRFYDLRWQDVTEVDEAAGQLAVSIEEIRGADIDGLAGTALGVLFEQLDVQADGTSAAFSTQASALADLQGNSSVAVVWRARAGGAVGEIELVTFEDAETGESASNLRFSADNVLFKGSVGMDLLTVGLGRNLIPNANFEQGLDDWTLSTAPMAETVFELREPPASYAGSRYPTAMIYQSGNANETARVRLDLARADGKGYGIPVKPGVTYEASAKLSTHRCRGRILITWCAYDGTVMGSDMVLSDDLNGVQGSSTNPEQWPQMGGIATAPAGAAFLRMFIEKDPTAAGQANSYLFFYQPQIVQTHADAVDLTPFAPGGTTLINGGNLITNSVTADRLNVDDLSAISANLGSIVAETGNIGDLAVTTLKVEDDAITVFDVAGSGAITNNSSTPTPICSVVLDTELAASSTLGVATVSLSTDPSSLPSNFEVNAYVGGILVGRLNLQAANQAGGVRRHTLSLSRTGISGSPVVVELEMKNMGGHGINSSNLWALARKK